MADHDCYEHAIHGALARRLHGKAVRECLRCGRWQREGLDARDVWYPAGTLRLYLQGEPTFMHRLICGTVNQFEY